MGIYWVTNAGSRYAHVGEQLSDEAWAAIVAGASLIGATLAWFFTESEPALPPGAAWGDLEPCGPTNQ